MFLFLCDMNFILFGLFCKCSNFNTTLTVDVWEINVLWNPKMQQKLKENTDMMYFHLGAKGHFSELLQNTNIKHFHLWGCLYQCNLKKKSFESLKNICQTWCQYVHFLAHCPTVLRLFPDHLHLWSLWVWTSLFFCFYISAFFFCFFLPPPDFISVLVLVFILSPALFYFHHFIFQCCPHLLVVNHFETLDLETDFYVYVSFFLFVSMVLFLNFKLLVVFGENVTEIFLYVKLWKMWWRVIKVRCKTFNCRKIDYELVVSDYKMSNMQNRCNEDYTGLKSTYRNTEFKIHSHIWSYKNHYFFKAAKVREKRTVIWQLGA